MNQAIKLMQLYDSMKKTKFPSYPNIGRIFFDGVKTYEYITNPFYKQIPGVKPQPCWIDISLELK